MVQCFGVDLSYLKDPESGIVLREVGGIPSAVFVARGSGGMLFQISCSVITVPRDVHSPNGYWFAGLFRLFRYITRLDPRTFFTCVAGFQLHLIRRRMVVSSISLDCFQVDEEGNTNSTFPAVNWNAMYIKEIWLCSEMSLRIFYLWKRDSSMRWQG